MADNNDRQHEADIVDVLDETRHCTGQAKPEEELSY